MSVKRFRLRQSPDFLFIGGTGDPLTTPEVVADDADEREIAAQ